MFVRGLNTRLISINGIYLSVEWHLSKKPAAFLCCVENITAADFDNTYGMVLTAVTL